MDNTSPWSVCVHCQGYLFEHFRTKK